MKLWTAVAVALLLDVVGVLAPGWPGAPGLGTRHQLSARARARRAATTFCDRRLPSTAAAPAVVAPARPQAGPALPPRPARPLSSTSATRLPPGVAKP